MSKNLKSILLCVAIFIFAAAILIAGVIFGKNSVTGSKANHTIAAQDEDTEADIIFSVDEDNASSLKLTVLNPAAPFAGVSTPVGNTHTSYTLTAELTPANTTDKLDLELSGVDADKITLDHEDGAFEAILTVNEAFSNTVTLTGTIRNRDISDSIKLDCLAKPQSINGNKSITLQSLSDTFEFQMYESDFSIGSLAPHRILLGLDLLLPTEIYDSLISKGYAIQQSKQLMLDEIIANGNEIDISETLFQKTIAVNIDQFLREELSGSALDKFNADLHDTLKEICGEDPLTLSLSGFGSYFAMVNGVETYCGEFTATQEITILSYPESHNFTFTIPSGTSITWNDDIPLGAAGAFFYYALGYSGEINLNQINNKSVYLNFTSANKNFTSMRFQSALLVTAIGYDDVVAFSYTLTTIKWNSDEFKTITLTEDFVFESPDLYQWFIENTDYQP